MGPKLVVLTLNDKIEIIKQLNKGVSGKILVERFGVGTSTISDKNNSAKILNFMSAFESDNGSSSRKVMKAKGECCLEMVLATTIIRTTDLGAHFV
jgi:hypothetical protein